MPVAEFINVFWEIAETALMVLTDDASFEQCPKRFHIVSVAKPINMLMGMNHGFMGHELFNPQVTLELISD